MTSEAMTDALEAGARRRAVVAATLQTPSARGATKRGLKASPGASTKTTQSTVTPEAKRHMSGTGSDSVSVVSVGSGTDSASKIGNPQPVVEQPPAGEHAETLRDEDSEQPGVYVQKLVRIKFILIYIIYYMYTQYI